MLRRGVWMVVGAAAGGWMVLKVQRSVSRLTPSGAAQQVRRELRHLANDVAVALAEGRRTKRSTEVALRQAPRARAAIDVAPRPGLPAAGPGEHSRTSR